MRLLLFAFTSLFIGQIASAQTYTFQFQENNYSDYGDVQIYQWDSDRSHGALGEINYNESSLLLRFGQINVPKGLYAYSLQFTTESVPSAGTVTLYQLKDANWDDPGVELNPPVSNSNYPTWSHINYNSRNWNLAGIVGGSDIEQAIGSTYVNATGNYAIGGATASIESTTDMAFLLTMSNNANLYIKETAPASTQNPKLILTLLEIYGPAHPMGSIDWNCFFRPYQTIR
jgi:hypothetical protein